MDSRLELVLIPVADVAKGRAGQQLVRRASAERDRHGNTWVLQESSRHPS